MPRILNSVPARIVTLLLLIQGAVLFSSSRNEIIPPTRPLAELPKSLSNWQLLQEGVVDQDSRDVLKADDLMLRTYQQPSTGQQASLLVAAFLSQSHGKAPHSPKNCLPGAGWTPLIQDEYQIDVGAPAPITVNRYVVQHAEERVLVMYWYQSRERVVANEYKAKYFVMVDAIRLNRTDTALVRVMVPMAPGDEGGSGCGPRCDAATRTAADFVKAFFGPLHQYLPA